MEFSYEELEILQSALFALSALVSVHDDDIYSNIHVSNIQKLNEKIHEYADEHNKDTEYYVEDMHTVTLADAITAFV